MRYKNLIGVYIVYINLYLNKLSKHFSIILNFKKTLIIYNVKDRKQTQMNYILFIT